MESVSSFFIYAITAAFLENMVFTRTLGVERLELYRDPRHLLQHGALLTGITFASSILSGIIGRYFLRERQMTSAVRALCYLGCIIFVYVLAVLVCMRRPKARQLCSMLPQSTFNCAVLGALVLSTSRQNSLAATAGFGLGAGVGYTLALLLIQSGRRRLEMITLPRAFKGMPVQLLYIGIVSLAIYGLIGHQIPT